MNTVSECIAQLKSCGYECQGGVIEMNIAFIRLEEIASSNYQPKFHLNEKVYYKDNECYVFSIRTKPSSHPDCEIEYQLSHSHLHQSTTNTENTGWVHENSICSFEQQKQKELKIANDIIKKYQKQ